uniref:General secretion pathway protein EL3 n=1 Tax=Malawimonas jakobiformis TaxID=136089 RepID=A0A895KR55_MALJA|nr:general secretion pathway protein EL3 [Malawimonas jakobiformis]
MHRVTRLLRQLVDESSSLSQQQHTSHSAVGVRPFRTLHTGTETTKLPLPTEQRRQLVLDAREKRDRDRSAPYPYTSLLVIRHVFKTAREMQALHIHLKYIAQSGETRLMFRTKQGLMSGGVIENKHWIKYLLMHAVGTEDYESAGEGEFRLDVLVDDDSAVRLEYTCNVVYTHDGVKLTLAPVG